jgi:hypothetical protein
VTNKENLGDNLTDELLNNVKDALGENFIYPDYATPYTEDSYYGFKKIRNLRLATGEYVRSKFRKLPLYTALNSGPITGRDMGFDFSLLKEEIEPDSEVVWFKPDDKEYCYLVNLGQYKDKDKILFERGDAIYVGKYNYQEKTMVLTDIMNAVSREEDDTPIGFVIDNQFPFGVCDQIDGRCEAGTRREEKSFLVRQGKDRCRSPKSYTKAGPAGINL